MTTGAAIVGSHFQDSIIGAPGIPSQNNKKHTSRILQTTMVAILDAD
jgi:hypothetical protein